MALLRHEPAARKSPKRSSIPAGAGLRADSREMHLSALRGARPWVALRTHTEESAGKRTAVAA